MHKDEYRKMFETEDMHWWFVSLHDLICRVAALEHKRKGSLLMLDAGCGTGSLCRLLAPYGSITGVDISEPALAYCCKRGLRNIRQGDLNTDDLGHEQFDIITCIDVLYHQAIGDELLILKKFLTALRPGGVLILNLPAFEFLRSSHDIAVQTRRRYTKRAVAALLREAGFLVEKSTYRVSLLFPLIALYRLARHKRAAGKQALAEGSDVWLPPAWINHCLCAIMKLENNYLRHASFPFGSSVFAIGRKPCDGEKKGHQ